MLNSQMHMITAAQLNVRDNRSSRGLGYRPTSKFRTSKVEPSNQTTLISDRPSQGLGYLVIVPASQGLGTLITALISDRSSQVLVQYQNSAHRKRNRRIKPPLKCAWHSLVNVPSFARSAASSMSARPRFIVPASQGLGTLNR
jgi:hypothetical protein